MNRLLSETLPLRTTRELGNFAVNEVLPQRFGDLRRTRFKLVKLSDSEWLAADHPMPITEVFVDDEATLGYDVQLRSDAAGNSYTVVRLAAPAPPDARVSASGIGRRNPRTGALLENPADIIEFVLRLAGRTETFPLLRAECSAADLVFAGSLDRLQKTREWIDEIAYSGAIIWTPSAACLYPTTVVKGQVVALDQFATLGLPLSADSALRDTADILHLSYDWNDATGRPQQFVRLTASPQRFGGIVAEAELRWLRSSGNAESVGRRMLQRMAGVRYDVQHSTDQTQLRPCRWTRFVSHPQWTIPGADPTPMVLKVEINTQTKTARISSEVIASVPTITVTAHSVALPSTVSGGVAIAIADGVLTATIYNNDGKPVKDALVSLDGAPAKKTNEEGKVAYTVTPAVPPKKHQLAVQCPGFQSYLLDVFF